MILHIKVVAATDIPKMDVIGKADPYLTIKYNKSKKEMKTSYCKQTYSPIWNEEFHVPVDIDGLIHMELFDWDKVTKDDLISTKDFPINTFQEGKISDDWYEFVPEPKIKKPGKVHLVFHLASKDQTPFVKNSQSKTKNNFYMLKPKLVTDEQYEFLLEAFNEIDEDHNGNINLSETKNFLEKIGVNHVFAPLAFEICDKNQNSTITFDEFRPFYKLLGDIEKDRSTIYKVLFDKFDSDKNGYLDKKEVVRLLFFFGGDDWNEDDAIRFIDNHDTNNDGKLNFNELCNLIEDEISNN
ncbi:Protein Aster-C [Tritrichomonas musculus]|uniref:Protein Aster-C n=1 Tax=Tritrichomonas musculus TaxID=1915356 RepID=A0ABR2KNB2_9EUKA